jgi:hypothetical protein
MIIVVHRTIRIAMAVCACTLALSWNGDFKLTRQGSLFTTAEAIIGRPLTPMSYAGVARRTTARAVGYGAAAAGAVAVGAAAAGAAAATVCREIVDPYGRVVTVCP